MSIKNPFTHGPGGEFGCLYEENQVQQYAWDRMTETMDRVKADLDPKYHGNRPDVICQLAAAMINAELLFLVNQSIQEGVMFLGKLAEPA